MFYVYILRSKTHPNQTKPKSAAPAICGSAFPNTTPEIDPHKQIQTLGPGGVCCVV